MENDLIKYLHDIYAWVYTNSYLSTEDFKSEEYKWKLGIKVVMELDETANDKVFQKSVRDTKSQLYGIDVEIDYHNPDNIQLWKNITDEIGG